MLLLQLRVLCFGLLQNGCRMADQMAELSFLLRQPHFVHQLSKSGIGTEGIE